MSEKKGGEGGGGEGEEEFSLIKSCPSSTEKAGKERICVGCPGQSFCLSSVATVDPEQVKLDVRMKAIKYKILVLAGKGGVGKSTVASQLAMTLANKGKGVGLMDVDICGPSIPKLLHLDGYQVTESPYGWIPPSVEWSDKKLKVMSSGFLLQSDQTPIVWRGPRKTSLIKRLLKDTYWGRLDYLIVDTPPGTSDEHLSVVASLKNVLIDGAVIVTTPQQLSLITVRKEIDFCKKMGVPIIGIIENMSGFVCPCCDEVTNIFLNGGGEEIAKEYQIPFLGRIPLDPRIGECGEAGSALFTLLNSPALSAAWSQIIDNLLALLKP